MNAFLAQAKKLKVVAEKKEKATWQKAFKNNSKEGMKEKQQDKGKDSSENSVEGSAAVTLEKKGGAEAKIDISKFVKGGGESSYTDKSSRDNKDIMSGDSSSSTRNTVDEEAHDVTKEDNLTMYILGGAVALALGIGALSLLSRKK